MKKSISIKQKIALLFLILTSATLFAQNNKPFDRAVENCNLALSQFKIIYFINKNGTGRYMKKIAAKQDGTIAVLDSITKDDKFPEPGCVFHNHVLTFNLFEFISWENHTVQSYLKDSKGNTYGKILGTEKDRLILIKELENLKKTCRRKKS